MRKRDPLFWTVLLLCFLGLLSLYSASPDRSFSLRGNFALRQCLWMIVAFSLFWVTFSVDYKKFYDLAYLLYGMNVLLLVLVLLLGRATRLGAQRWLGVGPFAFQPSEFIKITLVLAAARFLSGKDLHACGWRTLLGAFLLAAFPALLILKEPHLGTSLILFPILLGMLYAANLRRDFFLWILFMALIVSPLGWFILKEYQKNRLLIFINPNLDPLGAGYSVIQSRISLGSGWLFGKGYLSGTQSQLNFLPERHTDFIFSVIGEEWGFLGTSFLIFLYLFLVKRGLAIAARAREAFAQLVVAGLTTLLAGHIFVNIAMTMGFLPVVGLPLPFLSYGGSWLTSCLISVALILNVGTEHSR
ncbi:MAG: rod shape-determining protein RodA [Candidatus Omnitrophica bacterium]|nr:rod shape-determining protein RodA [Candidatus Omnitrophota bacterium]